MNKKHGHAKRGKRSPEYSSWYHIIQRCTNTKDTNYKNYGAKGITICEEWRNSFETFLSDMGPRPTVDHSIDRINNKLGYYKENCRWADKFTQRNNTSRTRKVIDTVTGEEFSSISVAARKLNIPICSLRLQLIGAYKNKTNFKLKDERTI